MDEVKADNREKADEARGRQHDLGVDSISQLADQWYKRDTADD